METVTGTITKPDVAAGADKLVRAMETSRFKECEYERTIYVATAFEATTVEDLLKPEYWVHVASKLKAWDRIEARADDGTWWAELMVLESGRTFTRVRLLRHYSLTTDDVAQTQAGGIVDYIVEWKGPHTKWRVVRTIDNMVVHEGAGSKESANDWLKNHRVALGK